VIGGERLHGVRHPLCVRRQPGIRRVGRTELRRPDRCAGGPHRLGIGVQALAEQRPHLRLTAGDAQLLGALAQPEAGRVSAGRVVVRQCAAGPTLVGRGDLACQVAVAAVEAGGQLVDGHHESGLLGAGMPALP
jgi:hypothetical protein